MKKVLTKIVTLLVALVLALGAFSGCGLITTNTDRDMAQVVASLSIGSVSENENAPAVHKDYFLKKELLAGYMSYGYYYVSSYGYTVSQAYSTVLESLIQSAVIVQQAKVGLADYYIVNKANTDTDKFEGYFVDTINKNVEGGVASAEALYNAGVSEADYEKVSKSGDYKKLAEYLGLYLSEYEKAQANYTVLNSISSMIETYKEAEDEENDKETETFTARATPTEDTEDDLDEFELKNDTPTDYEYKVVAAKLGNEADWSTLKSTYASTYDLNKHLYDTYKVELSSNEDKSALNKAIKQLKKNGLIASDENYDNTKQAQVVQYSYFQYLLKSQYESLIVSKYERSLKAEVEGLITEDALKAQFKAEYLTQWENYTSSYSAYETALDSATEDAPVYCNPYEGYGYVLNLLIGFTDEQTSILNELNSKAGITTEDKAKNREDMLKNLIVKDQRTTWVQSSYGTLGEGKFTFDDKYLVSEAGSEAYNKLCSYIGTTVLANEFEDKDDSGVATTTYSFKNVYSTGMDFDSFVTNYLKPLTGIEKKIYTDGSADQIGTLTDYTNDSATRKAFDDLMYAFSTDTGCLGKAFGYTYSPKTSATTYVKEFAAASEAVVKEGVGAYTIVATQYGYHIILCTKAIAKDDVLDADGNIDDAKLSAYYENKVKADYRETKIDSLLSDYVTKISNKMVNEYIDKAEYFNNTYSDLIETADDPAVDSSAN